MKKNKEVYEKKLQGIQGESMHVFFHVSLPPHVSL